MKHPVKKLTGQVAVLFSVATASFIALELLDTQAMIQFEPVHWRFLYWQSGLSFSSLLGGIAILILTRIFYFYRQPPLPEPAPAYRSSPRQTTNTQATVRHPGKLTERLFQGFALGLCAFSIMGATWLQPQPVRWDVTMQKEESLPEAQQRALKLATQQKRPLLYYFHADWCSTCEAFQRYSLSHPSITSLLQSYILVRLDVTDELWYDYMQQNFAIAAVPALRLGKGDGHLFGPILQGDQLSIKVIAVLLKGFQEKSNNRMQNRDQKGFITFSVQKQVTRSK